MHKKEKEKYSSQGVEIIVVKMIILPLIDAVGFVLNSIGEQVGLVSPSNATQTHKNTYLFL